MELRLRLRLIRLISLMLMRKLVSLLVVVRLCLWQRLETEGWRLLRCAHAPRKPIDCEARDVAPSAQLCVHPGKPSRVEAPMVVVR